MRKIARSLLYTYCLISAFGAPAVVFGQGVQSGLQETGERAGYGSNPQQIENIVGGLVNAVLAVLGIVFVVLLVYAGGLYLTARGDMDQVEKAKRLIQQAVIGMIIIATSYIIADFVLTELISAVGSGEA